MWVSKRERGYIESIDKEFDRFDPPTAKELMTVRYGTEPNFEAIPIGMPMGYGERAKHVGE